MINILSLHKVIKQIINIPNMKIVVEASSLLVTAIRKINEGQKYIVGIALQNNQTFSDWQQYQRSCKIYA